MADMSNYLAAKVLTDSLGGACFAALYTTNPTGADIGTEVVDSAYKRQPITFTTPALEAGKMTVKNTALVEFEPAYSGYGTITHIGIRSALVGGNLLYVKELTAPITATTGTGVRMQMGEIKAIVR